MRVHLPVIENTLFEDKTILPTGKYHVSYSEVTTALGDEGCGWRHKLQYVDKLEDSGSEHTLYGTIMHSALQEWLLQNKSVWFDWDEKIEQCQKEIKDQFELIAFQPSAKEMEKDWITPVKTILSAVPDWMDSTFPGWKTVAAELELFEKIEGHTNKWFKGFVDAIIQVPKQPRKGSKKKVEGSIFWILDWKTTSWGWDSSKKQNKYKRMQLALYKHYVHVKLGIPLEDIKCGFILLKRTAKAGNSIELLEVSVGDKTRQEAVDLVSGCVSMISKKLFTKNRNSCRFCRFRATPLCP